MKARATEKVVMNTETLDDGSAVINFDVFDTATDKVTQTGGYVMVTQDDKAKRFHVVVINHHGDVICENEVPFVFNQHENDDTYDEFGVNTKNSFNTPPKEIK
jgi:hypothetical protein